MLFRVTNLSRRSGFLDSGSGGTNRRLGHGQNPIAKKGKTREETLDILDLVGQYNNLTQL